MSYILFIDESGHDGKESPYEVLAGVAIEDRDLWNLIRAIQFAEMDCFGRRYSNGPRELKAKKLLKTKVYRHAKMRNLFDPSEQRELARLCLDQGEAATPDQLAALGQAKIEFVRRSLILCAQHHCRAFASIVTRQAQRTKSDLFLRKDYAYLFERFFYFLEDSSSDASGLIVFDEMEKSASYILVNQMYEYFQKTSKGQIRSSRIIPEPFFVHSELTTAIQLADLTAYIIAWNVRVGRMDAPRRPEMDELGQLVCGLRYRAIRPTQADPQYGIWSFAVIDDLRPSKERVE